MDQLQPGSCWTIRNAKVDMYRGCMRLAVDQFGKLEPATDASIEPKVRVHHLLLACPVQCAS